MRPPVEVQAPALFRPPSFRAVVAFEAAARYESFARAAAELSLSQSAISHAIRGLEGRIGELLFVRRGRRVALTPEGAQLAQRIRASLALLAGALADPATQGAARRVVIGAPREFAAQVLLPRLAAGDLLDSCEVRTVHSVDALRDGAADVLIVRSAKSWPALTSRPFGQETVFPVAAPAIARIPGYPDLRQLPVIENTGHPWGLWLAQLHRTDELPGLGLIVDDWGLALDAARAGGGVCLARSSLVQDDLDQGRLVRVGRLELALQEGYHLLWDPRARRRSPVEAVIAWLTRDLSAPQEEPWSDAAEAARERSAPRLRLVDPAGPPRAKPSGHQL